MGEPAAERVEAEWVADGAAISSINLGEVLYIRMRASGEQKARADIDPEVVQRGAQHGCTVVDLR